MTEAPIREEVAAGAEERPPYLWAALAGFVVFLLYWITLAPTTQFWDTSEYIATAHILGIPHPPGNPTFVILARTWDILLSPFRIPEAMKINLFSATMSAAAHGLWFLVAHRILGYFSEDRRFRLVGAAVAVTISATAYTVWNQSNVNEKVYTVSLFTIVLLTWLAFRWRQHVDQERSDNLLVLMVFILALSVGNHLMAFLAAPALAVYILVIRPRALLDWKLYAAAVLAVFVGLSIHLVLPIRAALNPVINEADPTCRSMGGALTSIVTWGQAGCANLSAVLTRQQYEKPPLVPRLAPLTAQFGNYLQYFDWQWARALQGTDYLFAPARIPFTLLFTFLGIFGATEHYRRDKASWAYMLVLFLTLSVALVFYLNFKYGYSFPSPADAAGNHEVRERDYFFVVGFSVWGIWAGIGLAALWQELSERWGGSLARGAPVLAVALLPLFLNWAWASRARDYSARDWAYNLLMSVEPYGVLFTNGDNDTFPLWYLQEVEGIRRDVTVIVTSYLNTNWYVKQLKRLTGPCPSGVDPLQHPTRAICQRPYESSNTTGAYVADSTAAPAGKVPLVMGHPVAKPKGSIIGLDDATIDRVAGNYVPVEREQTYQVGNIRATIPAGQYLYPWHQFALAIIDHSLGDRPIFFASSGNAAESLGLSGNLVREGLAFKLYNGELNDSTAPSDFASMAGSRIRTVTGPWLNVPRTRKLMDQVFVHHTGIPEEWGHWPDHSTIGIPNYYAWGFYALAQAAATRQDTLMLERAQDRANAWLDLGTSQ